MEITIRKAEKKDAERLCELLETIAQLHHNGRPDIYGANGAKYDIPAVEEKISKTDEIILVAVNEEDFVLGYTMSKSCDATGIHSGSPSPVITRLMFSFAVIMFYPPFIFLPVQAERRF